MKFDNLLRYAVRVIDAYSGDKPLPVWFKEFFRANPQMGSRDRKLVSEMVYCFYRLGHSLKSIPVGERILAGLFLCNEGPMDALEYLRPEWNENIGKPIEDKIRLLREKFPDFSIGQIFPWKNILSAAVDHTSFCLSFLKKPVLFIIAFGLGAYLFYAQHNFPGVTFAENNEWAYEKAALESSSYMMMNPVMAWLTGNIGYHHIHHLNSKIPFYRLPEVMKDFKELQNCKRTSLSPKEVLACLRLKIWDQEKHQMVGLRDIR